MDVCDIVYYLMESKKIIINYRSPLSDNQRVKLLLAFLFIVSSVYVLLIGLILIYAYFETLLRLHRRIRRFLPFFDRPPSYDIVVSSISQQVQPEGWGQIF